MLRYIKKKIKQLLSDQSDKLYYRIENQNSKNIYAIKKLISTAELHKETFSEFKGCFQGKSIVIVGAGPSISNFKPIDNCIYIGLNSACRLDLPFNFLFTIDKIGIEKYYDDFANRGCLKFVGDQDLGPDFQIPESVIYQLGNVRRYKTDTRIQNPSSFTVDIDSQPLGNFNTVSLQAAQFALYTNPDKIYLVGIDCTSKGHFYDNSSEVEEYHKRISKRGENYQQWQYDTVKFWQEFKSFANTYYPETSIISVNPIGLKGLFEDLIQQ